MNKLFNLLNLVKLLLKKLVKSKSGNIACSLFLFVLIVTLMAATQLGRKNVNEYIADEYLGNIGEIFGSKLVATNKKHAAGNLMIIPDIFLKSGNYHLVLDVASDSKNFSPSLCRIFINRNTFTEKSNETFKNKQAIKFGKHKRSFLKKQILQNKCKQEIRLTYRKMINANKRLYSFHISKQNMYLPLELRVKYNGKGTLEIFNLYITLTQKHFFSSKLIAGAMFGSLFYFLMLLFIRFRIISTNFFGKLLFWCSPLIIILIYSIYNFIIHDKYFWGSDFRIALYCTFILIFVIPLFTTNIINISLTLKHRLLIMILIIVSGHLSLFADHFFIPTVSLRLRSLNPHTWHLSFFEKKNVGHDKISQYKFDVDSSTKFKDYKIKLPSNRMVHWFTEIENRSTKAKEEIIIELQRINVSTLLENRSIEGKDLFFALRSIDGLKIKRNKNGAIQLNFHGQFAKMEFSNLLFAMGTFHKKEFTYYSYLFLFCLFLITLIYINSKYENHTINKLIYSNEIQLLSTMALYVYLFIGIIIILITGPTVSTIYGQDIFTVLEMLWRALQGIRPHADYNSGVYGPMIFFPQLVGYFFDGHTAYVFTYGKAFIFLTLSLFGFSISLKRFSILGAWIFVLYLGCLIVGTHVLGTGDGHEKFSLAMTYNRYGYALISLMSVLLFIRPTKINRIDSTSKSRFIGIASITMILFFLKLSYFIVSLYLLAIAWFLVPWNKKQMNIFLLTSAILLLIGMSYLRFDFSSMLSDFKSIFIVSSDSGDFSTKLFSKLYNVIHELFILVLACCFFFIDKTNRTIEIKKKIIVIVGLILADLLLLASNYQFFEMPLIVLCFIILFDFYLIKYLENQNQGSKTALLGVMLLGLVACSKTSTSHLYHIINSFKFKIMKQQSFHLNENYKSEYLKDIILLESKTAKEFNNLFLISYHILKKNEQIFVLSHNNAINYSLKLKTLSDSSFHFWHYDYNFNLTHHPDAKKLFKEIDIVFIRKRKTYLQKKLLMVYSLYIRSNYKHIFSSKYWDVFKKNITN